MSRDDVSVATIILLLLLFGAILGGVVMEDHATAKMQRAAVTNGSAEWVVTPETGETTFRWKDLP